MVFCKVACALLLKWSRLLAYRKGWKSISVAWEMAVAAEA